jgi:hypothetical protein
MFLVLFGAIGVSAWAYVFLGEAQRRRAKGFFLIEKGLLVSGADMTLFWGIGGSLELEREDRDKGFAAHGGRVAANKKSRRCGMLGNA